MHVFPSFSALHSRSHRFSLMLALSVTLGSAHAAIADLPSFEGTFTSPELCSPRGIGLWTTGDVYVGSDCGAGQHMEHFNSAGMLVGTWGFPEGFFGSANGVAMDDSDHVYVTDYDGGRVLKFTSADSLLLTWSSFKQPNDLEVDGSGNVFVSDLGSGVVQEFTQTGEFSKRYGTAGTGTGSFQDPEGIGLDGSGRVYVADFNQRILRFQSSGDFDMEFTLPFAPSDVAVGPDGNIYVIGFYESQIHEYSPSGMPVMTFGPPDGLDGAFRIVVDRKGRMFVSEQYHTRIAEFLIDPPPTITVHTTLGRIKALYR